MPKEKRKKSSDGDAIAPKEKKAKKTKRLSIEDEIGKSKQLAAKLKTPTRRVRKNSKYPEPRVGAKGKIMPSLAELERMFECSDDDEDITPAAPPSPERCKTPDQPIIPDPKKILTPKTIQEISNKMLELISTLPDASALPDDAPPLPVVPQEPKRKKNGEPYIVGCKERDKIPDAPSSAVIGKAWDKYGINYNFKREEDDDEPSKRSKVEGSISKSIFNPKSEEIAAMLESSDILSDGSVDSNKTVPYEYGSLSPKMRTFSPLPSTSKDNETFLKNDLRFNESLIGDNVSNNSSQSEVEVIELPCETIMVDDEADVDSRSCVKPAEPDVTEITYPPPTFDTFIEDDLYSSVVIDLDQTYDNDDCEIIDVDEVLAENKNIIDKYKKESFTNKVTSVQTGTLTHPNPVQAKQEPIIVDEMESNPVTSTLSNRDKIERIVTDYFKRQPPNNVSEVGIPPTTETIDLSDSSTDPSMFKNIMDSFRDFTKSLVESWTKRSLPTHTSSPRKRRQPTIIDTIDLDQNNFGSNLRSRSNNWNDSITFVDTTGTIGSNNNPSTTFGSTPNDSSVIIVGNVNVNVTSTNANVEKKKKPRKRKKVMAPETPAVPPPPNNLGTSTPPVRTIGDCPICMENLSNNAIASTICGHIFCMKCIQAAIKASGKKCPTCRKALRGVGYHQLFL